MDGSWTSLYKLDRWRSDFGEWPLYPDAVEEVVRDVSASYSYAERACRFMIVNLVLDGELYYRCNGNDGCVVGAGELFIIPINSDYAFSTTQMKRYHKLVLEIKGHLLPATCDILQLSRPLHLDSQDVCGIELKIRNLGALLKAGREGDVPLIQAALHEVLSDLSLAARTVPEEDLRLLAKAKSRLEDGFDRSLSIAGLASELGVSYSMLNKLFNRRAGISPLKYRTHRKMEEARRLLSHTSLSIKEISIRLGYSNQLYFSSDFKRSCRVSPKGFRNGAFSGKP